MAKNRGDRKKRLKDAYAKILRSSGENQSAVERPEMEDGIPQWYGPTGSSLRASTAAGYMREAESQFPATPKYGLRFNMIDNKTGKPAERAFSSSAGLINLPDIDNEGGGYFSKPQYLENVIDHEVAHNVDYTKNRPKVPHSKETFRPLEQAAMRASQLGPEYNPGDAVGIDQINEYPDRYKKLSDYVMKYYVGQRPDDLTRSVQAVEPKYTAKAVARQRKNFSSAQGKTHRRTDSGPAQPSLS